ncbi:ABC transporter ATP-binding protein [Phycicoccus sp. Soil803]|nr:ABC transporter ATP-binding protein [Phycicoccus sp. Soil803]
MLRAAGLAKRFGDNVAVSHVSFDLAAGESLGIVGESGSGKSTTARMLVGLETPSEGTIEFFGNPTPTNTRAARLHRAKVIQMIFQDPYQSFDSRLTVAHAVEEPLRLHTKMTRPERNAEVARLLDQVGLTGRQGKSLPRELSGGQRQRAAIARALGINPRILVLDEAVAALDVSIQAQVMEVLNTIRSETGVAFVFVSHDLGVVRYMTDRTLVMRHGVVVEQGDTEHLLASPAHPYTRLLLDSVPAPGWDLDQLARDRRELGDQAAVS